MATEGEKSKEALREEAILAWWDEHRIFEKSLQKASPSGEFVFYEGPPTANGRPGIHHLESRAFKDAIPRYKTMRGYHVGRKAGWDTHGLPVELEVEKQLGFSGKPDIEKYGVAAFNQKCRESVGTYIDEWSRFTKRIGYWVDQGKAYFTYDATYMESLWNIVKQVSESGRLYKDYKVLPWCARCGTALSSHELAQGYEDVKDLSITAKFELVDEPGTYLLAWTTTPWTLPGNVALAVGEDIEYGVYEKDGAKVISAVLRAEALGLSSPSTTMKGSALIGKKYKPLFGFLPSLAPESEKPKFEKAYQVYPATFVTTEEGTGIVHTAVMYGADDFELGTEIGLPKVHAVGVDGKFIEGAGAYAGRFVADEAVAVDILKDLQANGNFFSKESYTHSYPFCWRCKTRLIYYARDSWYIRMQDLRDTLIGENAKVSWEPEHIRDGRMGEWLSNVKDWAISRERYWGTPLPVWESEDGSERVIIGSVEELTSRTPRSGNRYFVMRHGESENNVNNIVCDDDSVPSALTEYGEAQAERAGALLLKEGITKIIASPLMRGRQTAEAVAKSLGIPKEQIVYDPRVSETRFGERNGTSRTKYEHEYQKPEDVATKHAPGGESWNDLRKRVGEVLYELEQTYKNETIVVITHGAPMRMMTAVSRGLTIHQYLLSWETARDPGNGEVRELSFVPLPHNDDYELDLHRPYIDDVVLLGDRGAPLHRVKEVMDVWFDSGAMPFAQDHYPFKNKEWVDTAGYPADYISEAIDQTRGWFYTLLAVGVLKGKGHAYKNVICLGHLLDEKGRKMSKSKGNVIDPWTAMEEWGVDTLRFWMYSVNRPGDSKSFDPKTVQEAARVLSWTENSANFYELFKGGEEGAATEVIDRWMESRVRETITTATRALDAYDLYLATRSIAGLSEDLSQWYVRRIRDRVREGDAGALGTLRKTLRALALLLAPFSPFIAEEIWQKTRYENDTESIHLAEWPIGEAVDEALIADMKKVREYASVLLKLRQQANIVVRQPLTKATIPEALSTELSALLGEEINVESVVVGSELSLDTTITPELIAKRDEREFARAVAEARKTAGYSPKDTVEVVRGEGPYTAELSTGPVSFSLTKNAS